MSDAKRQKIEAGIAAGKARQAKRAGLADAGAAAKDKLTTAAREHPLLLVAGGLAIGAVLSTLIPKSPTRKLSKNALGMLATVAQLGLTYGRQALETAGDAASDAGKAGRERLDQVGSAISDGAARIKDRVRP